MGKITMIWQNKGGVGKSTTTANLASGLAVAGKKTIIVSGDSQNDSLWMLGKDYYKEDPGLKAMIHGKDGTIKIMDNLDYIPLEMESFSYQLKEKTSILFSNLKEKYDYIFIDCSPSVGDGLIKIFSELTTKVLVPTELNELCFNAIERMTDGIVDFDKVKYIVPTLSKGKVKKGVFTLPKSEQKWYDNLSEICEFGDLYLGEPIPYRAFQEELTGKRKTIWESNSKAAEVLQEAYTSLIEVIIGE